MEGSRRALILRHIQAILIGLTQARNRASAVREATNRLSHGTAPCPVPQEYSPQHSVLTRLQSLPLG
jgi:hypothetical protein